jgi:hypothetical protein
VTALQQLGLPAFGLAGERRLGGRLGGLGFSGRDLRLHSPDIQARQHIPGNDPVADIHKHAVDTTGALESERTLAASRDQARKELGYTGLRIMTGGDHGDADGCGGGGNEIRLSPQGRHAKDQYGNQKRCQADSCTGAKTPFVKRHVNTLVLSLTRI